MPIIKNIEEAKEQARGYQNSPDYSTICVDSNGSIYLNRDAASLKKELADQKLEVFQVRPEIAIVEEPKSKKKLSSNE